MITSAEKCARLLPPSRSLNDDDATIMASLQTVGAAEINTTLPQPLSNSSMGRILAGLKSIHQRLDAGKLLPAETIAPSPSSVVQVAAATNPANADEDDEGVSVVSDSSLEEVPVSSTRRGNAPNVQATSLTLPATETERRAVGVVPKILSRSRYRCSGGRYETRSEEYERICKRRRCVYDSDDE